MPKRDAAYMQGQREHIARMALECMLEKGLADSSIRDICTRAGVSMGTIYSYFSDRNDLVLAACAVSLAQTLPLTPARSWKEYEAHIMATGNVFGSPSLMNRLRITYQFTGELAVAGKCLEDSAEFYDHYYDWYRESLGALHAAGEVALPLGLDQTVNLHAKLHTGALHAAVIERSLGRTPDFGEIVPAMAMLAGLK